MTSRTLELKNNDVRLLDLPSHDYSVPPSTQLAVVAEVLKERDHLPGVLVEAEGAIVGMLSRDKYLEWMSHPFGPSLFLSGPITKLLKAAELDFLELLGSATINEAAELALNRPNSLVYEPIVVLFDDGQRRLLDTHVLLLTQSQMLKRANESIRREQRIAEAAYAAKSAFLASMSHEIRTPLNGIIGMAELLRDTELTQLQQEYLSLVKSSGESLLTVINDILDFSKVEVGKLELHCEPFDLLATLGAAMKSLVVRAHEKDLALTCRVPPQIPRWIIGDSGRVRQILINLVGNAIKFTESGEVGLDVSLKSATERHVELHFQVHDTGIGVPPEKQASIFNAFEQADNTTSRRFGGTGLGLAICRNLVRLMHGRLWLESEVGKGSTFHFTVRLDRVEKREQEQFPQADPRVAGVHALLFDEHPRSRRIVTELLTHWGLRVTSCDSLETALSESRRAFEEDQPFQLYVIDDSPSGGDAFEAWRNLRELASPGAAALMLLASAARSVKQSQETGLRCLVKPLLPTELLQMVHVIQGVAEEPETGATNTGQLDVGSHKTRRVLLVEDSLVNQKVAVGLLRKWGHDVTLAVNGHEALSTLGDDCEAPFDIVLMDVQMPGMDGVTATGLIRERRSAKLPRLPIVAMTAHAMKGDRERFLEAGMDEYVSKPLRADELRDVLDRLCAEADSEDPERVATSGARAESAAVDNQSPDTGSDDADTAGEATAESNSDAAPNRANVDWAEALRTTGGDAKLLKELVQAFLQECDERIVEMERCLANGDRATLARAAHTVKGGSRHFGAGEAFATARDLESLAMEGADSEVRSAVEAVNSALDNLMSELRTFVADPSVALAEIG